MSQLRIFIVEDEPDIQKLLRMSLEMLGKHQIEIYGSGEEGLEHVAAFQPDIILLDVMLPEMDGPEVFSHLQQMEDLQHVPVVFITARVRPQDVASYRALGATDVISKPFNAVELPKKIEEIYKNSLATS